MEHYLSEKVVKTASPSQMHVDVYGSRAAILTGFFKGTYTRKFAVTVAHLVNKIGDGLYAGNELLGKCCFKSNKTKIAGQTYTTDLALIAVETKSRYARYKHTVIEIQGQRYRQKLSSDRKVHGIMPGDEVWVLDQYESWIKGKVFRHWYNNESIGLHNVMQIKTIDGKALTAAGDSGCCVFLPPKLDSDVIEVIGMVTSTSDLPDNTTCTNAVLLPIILRHYLRNLPPNLKKVGPLCEDEGLPANIEFMEGFDFYSSEESGNLTVQSENS